MSSDHKRRVEFGDWQTPDDLALACCRKLDEIGICPDVIIEPTCGVGAFVMAAIDVFNGVKNIRAYEVNGEYLSGLNKRLLSANSNVPVSVSQSDFFDVNWREEVNCLTGYMLVLGNFPWVTSSQLGSIGGKNLPEKSNFQGHKGFDAITGKANFDISEWMLMESLRWFVGRRGAIAMLVKTAVARKVIAQAPAFGVKLKGAAIYNIDAKKHFSASVDASLLVMEMDVRDALKDIEYTVYKDLNSAVGTRVGLRAGKTIGDLDAYDTAGHLLGQSPQKWRSGVKHDASSIMELTRTDSGLRNGLDELVLIEDKHIYPLLKGSDIGSGKQWREKFVIITQRNVGESTHGMAIDAPLTWAYLEKHSEHLNGRGSSIYAKNPCYSIFGIGDYAFRPWKIAICALYKKLEFRLVGPIEGRPVMFDDTIYYVSFDTQAEAESTLACLNSESARRLLSALIFWDEKRPIKTAILNAFDWEKLSSSSAQALLI